MLPPHVRSRVSYAVGAAADRVDDAAGADAALVDPPRKGLDPALLDALCDRSGQTACAGLRTLVYVSCGFPALRRDADFLLSAGWRVAGGAASAHVLFWGANHIETVVVFERAAEARVDNPLSVDTPAELSAAEAPPAILGRCGAVASIPGRGGDSTRGRGAAVPRRGGPHSGTGRGAGAGVAGVGGGPRRRRLAAKSRRTTRQEGE